MIIRNAPFLYQKRSKWVRIGYYGGEKRNRKTF